MRRLSVSVSLALLMGLLPAVLGSGSWSSSPASAAEIPRLQAVPADSIVDSYGVGIHLAFLDTPYRDATAVADALSQLGVRHVRDDLFMNNPRQYDGIRTVAERGIGFDLIMGSPTSPDSAADYVNTVATQLPPGAVESLEGTNEWDLSGRPDWASELRTRQAQLYAAAKANAATADLPVLSPALAFRWDYPAVGDLSPYADEANGHMYPGGYQPSNEIDRITAAIRGAVGDKPLVATESGYHNAVNTDNGHLPVPEDVAGVYMPRLLLEHYRRGEKRVYSYELIDEFDDPGLTNPEAHFGLLRHDLTPKPAYTAMKDLLALLADPGAAFTPGSLAITADGFPADGHYLLTQKRNGQFVLLLWRDVRIYDPVAKTPLPVTPAPVTLRLGVTSNLAVYRPTDGPSPVTRRRAAQLSLKLDGEVTAVTIDPVRTGAPGAGATGAAGPGRSTPSLLRPARPSVTSVRVRHHRLRIAWRRPAAVQAVAGYRLRVGSRTLTPGPRTHAVTVRGVRAGHRVRLVLRARNAAGWSRPVTRRLTLSR